MLVLISKVIAIELIMKFHKTHYTMLCCFQINLWILAIFICFTEQGTPIRETHPYSKHDFIYVIWRHGNAWHSKIREPNHNSQRPNQNANERRPQGFGAEEATSGTWRMHNSKNFTERT